jgi:type VI secretion system protein ImpK
VRDLSPNWRGQSLAINPSRIRIPVWVVAATAAALLFGLYVGLRILLSGGSETAAAMTATLHPDGALQLKRLVFAPPPPPPPPPPKPVELPDDPCISYAQTANWTVIRVCSAITFASGEATVLDRFKPIAAQIAAALNKKPGKIKVVGHTDNSPIKTPRFPSNYELSVERAKAVATLLKSGLTDPNRVDIEGKGQDQPIASNASPDGRAQNRRVEVMISRANE